MRNLQSFSQYFETFYQIFLSPQVKRCAIITYKHGIYELPSDLRKGEMSGRCLKAPPAVRHPKGKQEPAPDTPPTAAAPQRPRSRTPSTPAGTQGTQPGGQRPAPGNQRLPARVRLPPTRRCELPAAIAQPMPKRPRSGRKW